MNGMSLGAVSVVVNILLGLFFWAYFYDRTIARMGVRGEGWAWLQVVFGVFVTLVGIGLLDVLLNWNAFFISLLAFSASGAPMCWGAWKRHQEAEARARKAMQE